ncbi:MAG: hypothetical protein GXO93_04845, partial [FCB group bacterium]|nr:hypothetical protein [FCB group bacterium]
PSFDASTGICVSGNYVYVADYTGGLVILKYIP